MPHYRLNQLGLQRHTEISTLQLPKIQMFFKTNRMKPVHNRQRQSALRLQNDGTISMKHRILYCTESCQLRFEFNV